MSTWTHMWLGCCCLRHSIKIHPSYGIYICLTNSSLYLSLQALFLLNNEITKIHPRAFRDMNKLKLLYLSYNMLTEIPANLPKSILELRLSDNNINRIQQDAFKGMMSLQVLGRKLMNYFRTIPHNNTE